MTTRWRWPCAGDSGPTPSCSYGDLMWSAAPPPSVAEVRDAFGVEVATLREHPGGFEADAFTDGRWFIKLWRAEPDSNESLALTGELAARGVPVPAAQQALDGSYTATTHDGSAYALFPFVNGRPGSWDDTENIARQMRFFHEITDLALPSTRMDEGCIEALRQNRDHPWLGGFRDEVLDSVDRLEVVIDQARAINVDQVVCHHDLFPHNVLVDADGCVTALLDWGHMMLAPREHDLFTALCGPQPVRFLRAYAAHGLDVTHLEYARLARSLRDIAARISSEVDRDGIDTWGIDGLRRVEADLELVRPFCSS